MHRKWPPSETLHFQHGPIQRSFDRSLCRCVSEEAYCNLHFDQDRLLQCIRVQSLGQEVVTLARLRWNNLATVTVSLLPIMLRPSFCHLSSAPVLFSDADVKGTFETARHDMIIDVSSVLVFVVYSHRRRGSVSAV